MKDTRYADPYLAGIALGLVLLAALAITGRGLGASGAFATTAAGVGHNVLLYDGSMQDWSRKTNYPVEN